MKQCVAKSGYTPSLRRQCCDILRAMSYQSINPSTGELVKSFDQHTDTQLDEAIATAAKCFEAWRKHTYAQKASIVSKVAALMRERAEGLARLVTLEMGKLFAESVGEVMLSADILDYYSKHGERFLSPEHLNPDSGTAVIESSPLGVLFGVQPWNFPYYQLARFAGPNLMAGNVVMVKHSGTVPQCAIAFEKLWLDAGAPKGAYTNLLISHEQVLAVIDDSRIRGVALTGGVAAARGVAEGPERMSKRLPWS